MIGRRQPRHFEHRVGDDLGLAALLGANARISTRRMDQTDYRHVELGRQVHLGQRFAIAFRVCTAGIAGAALFEGFAFLMAHKHHPIGIEFRPAGADGPIVAKELVAVQFNEFVEHQFEVVGGHGPVGVPGDLDRLPRLQLAIDLLLQVGQLAAEPADLVANIRHLRGGRLQFRQAGLHLIDRCSERETMGIVSHVGTCLCQLPTTNRYLIDRRLSAWGGCSNYPGV